MTDGKPLLTWCMGRAVQECRRAGATHVGIPHALLALLDEPSVQTGLERLGLNGGTIAQKLRQVPPEPGPADSPLSHSLKRAFGRIDDRGTLPTGVQGYLEAFAGVIQGEPLQAELEAIGLPLGRLAEECPRTDFKTPASSMPGFLACLAMIPVALLLMVVDPVYRVPVVLTPMILVGLTGFFLQLKIPRKVEPGRHTCQRCGYRSEVRAAFVNPETCTDCARQQERNGHGLFLAGLVITCLVTAGLHSTGEFPARELCGLFAFVLAVGCSKAVGVVLHEGGHVVAAYLTGAAPTAVLFGKRTWGSVRIGGLLVSSGNPFLGAVTLGRPPSATVKVALYLLAGPAINLAVALISGWAALTHPQLSLVMWAACASNLWLASSALLPWPPLPGFHESDGRQLANLLSARSRLNVAESLLSLTIATSLWEHGDRAAAIHTVRQAVEQGPLDRTESAPRVNLGVWLLACADREWEEARNLFRDLLSWDLQPGSRAVIQNNLAWTLALLGEALDEAQALAEAALAQQPERQAFRGTRAAVLIALGQAEEGRTELLLLLKEVAEPVNAALQACWLAIAEQELGHQEGSREALALARRVDPSSCLLSWAERKLGTVESTGLNPP